MEEEQMEDEEETEAGDTERRIESRRYEMN